MARCSLPTRTMESFSSAASGGAQSETDPSPRPPARLRAAPQPDPIRPDTGPGRPAGPPRTHRAGRHGARLAPRPPEVRAASRGAAGRSRKRRRDPLWSPAHPPNPADSSGGPFIVLSYHSEGRPKDHKARCYLTSFYSGRPTQKLAFVRFCSPLPSPLWDFSCVSCLLPFR